MADKKAYHRPTTLSEAWGNPRYQGKIIVAAGGKVMGTADPGKAVQLLRRMERKYPGKSPETTIIPKDGTVVVVT